MFSLNIFRNVKYLFSSLFFIQPKKKVGKKVAAAPLAVKKVEQKKEVNPLFEKRPRNFGIGEFFCTFTRNLYVNMTIRLVVSVTTVFSLKFTVFFSFHVMNIKYTEYLC